MNKVRNLSVNFKMLDELSRIAVEAAKDHRAANKAINDVEAAHKFNGTYGSAEMKYRVDALKAQRSQRVMEHQQNAKTAYDAFCKHLLEISSPHGEAINEGDAMLLQSKLIRNAAELETLQAKYLEFENEAMLRMIENYAKEQKWEGFTVLTNYKAVADFGKRLYKTTTDAIQANDPDASYAAQYMAKHTDSALDFVLQTENA